MKYLSVLAFLFTSLPAQSAVVFDVCHWYWTVEGSTTQVWSSEAGAYVPLADAKFTAWLARSTDKDIYKPTTIANEVELVDVFLRHPETKRCPQATPKTVFAARQLIEALMTVDAAETTAAFNGADPLTLADSIAPNDPRILAAASAVDFLLRN